MLGSVLNGTAAAFSLLTVNLPQRNGTDTAEGSKSFSKTPKKRSTEGTHVGTKDAFTTTTVKSLPTSNGFSVSSPNGTGSAKSSPDANPAPSIRARKKTKAGWTSLID